MNYSFIIPALDEEKYIEACIASIKTQSKKPFEIIVVDNESRDKTAEIARALGCRVVKEGARGLSYARNKGAEVAKGDVLCFIDADGVLKKDWLEYTEKEFSKGQVSVVSGLNITSNETVAHFSK